MAEIINIKERSIEEKVDYLIEKYALQEVRVKKIEEALILTGEVIDVLFKPLIPILEVLKEWQK